MTSQKQIEANRRNAQKSTGPQTEAGKSVTRYNSVTHGCRVKGIDFLPNENPDEFHSRLQSLLDTYQPANEDEHRLVQEAAALSWKLNRADRYESATLKKRVGEAMAEVKGEIRARVNRQNPSIHDDPRIHCDEFTEDELAEIDDAANRALFDPSNEAERFRKYQAKLKRDRDKTVETIRKFKLQGAKLDREQSKTTKLRASEPILESKRSEDKEYAVDAKTAESGDPRRTEAEISASEPILSGLLGEHLPLLGEDLPTPPTPGPKVSQAEISASEPILEPSTPETRASEPILEPARAANRQARRAREVKKRKRKMQKAARKVQARH
jgi:hypothetical protein